MFITSMGHFHPENQLPNDFFNSLNIGSDPDWVSDRTGILSRRSVLSCEDIRDLKFGRVSIDDLRANNKFMTIAQMAGNSWDHLIKNRKLIKKDLPKIDGLICGTSVPDFDIPANACSIGAEIESEALAFDVNSACSSFVVGLHVARGLLESGMNESIGLFNPERYSLRLDYSDRSSAILFGDGSSCALLSAKDACGLKVVDTLVFSDSSKFNTVCIPESGTFMQNGNAVQKFAISKTIEATKKILAKNNLEVGDISYFIAHQANLRMIESAVARLGISPERHLFNVDQFGNQGSAGAPCVLSMNWQRFKKGDLIVMAVVGSGLTWGAAIFSVQ